MAITFTCPNCRTTIRAKDENAGAKTICPDCKAQFQVPNPAVLDWLEEVEEENPRRKPNEASRTSHAAELEEEEEERPRRKPTRVRMLSFIPFCVGAGFLLISFVTPWWRISLTESKERGEIGDVLDDEDVPNKNRDRKTDKNRLNSLKKRLDDEETRDQILIENRDWYMNNIGERRLKRFSTDFDEKEAGKVSLWLWGWNTGTGIFALIVGIVVLPLVIVPVFVKMLRLWSWIGSFVIAIPALVLFILGLVWIFGSPHESVSGLLSQGVIAGPFLVSASGLLLLVIGLLDGYWGLRLFISRMKAI